jgi:hypothetical protein
MESYPNTHNCCQDRGESRYQSTGFRFQHIVDEHSKLQPAQGFKTAPIPPSLAISSTDDPLPSGLRHIGVAQDSDIRRLQETHSTDTSQPALTWNIVSKESSYNLEDLQVNQPMNNSMNETENRTFMKTQLAKKRRLLEPMNWQHISSTELKPHEVIKDTRNPRKFAGRRHGRLNPDTAKNAQEMRHIRACLPCSILKIKVS